VFISVGLPVKKGDSLFQLHNEDSKLSADNARLASETNNYKSNLDKLKEAGNAINIAEKKLKNDSILYFRQLKLWENEIGSKLELEQKELNYENAKYSLNNAKLRYKDLNKQLKFAASQSENQLRIAELTEGYAIIKSKIDGVIYKIYKEKGEFANTINPLAVIGSDEFYVSLNIDEVDIVKIDVGQNVFVKLSSYKDEIFEATIDAIEPMMNERTRSFTVKALFKTKPKDLYLNLTAEANIVIHTKQDAMTIPRVCMVNDSSIIIKGGELKIVETGLMDYNTVEIIAGIDENTEILVPEE
jgi:multidrug resistance efflux pump